jgi:hypothetical protein
MDDFELTRKAFGEPEDDPMALERARARLLEAIHAEGRGRASHRRRFLLPASAAAALAAAVAIVVAVVPMGGTAAAAAELRRLGAIASSRQLPEVGPGEFLLVVTDELRPETTIDTATGSSYTVVSRLQLRTWIARDGSSVRRTEVLSSELASEADRSVWEQAGRPDLPRAGDVREESSRSAEFTWVDLSRLPHEPAELLAALRSGSIVPRLRGDDEAFLLIGQLLAQGNASPGLRASLFEAAARLEGVQEVGSRVDPLGREGLALAIDGPSLRTQLIFDPETAELQAIELYESGADGSVGALRSWSAFHRAMVVDSSPEP